MKKEIRKKMNMSNRKSNVCPWCDHTIKAHQGNTKHFKELTPSEMNSSLGITFKNVNDMMKLMAKNGYSMRGMVLNRIDQLTKLVTHRRLRK